MKNMSSPLGLKVHKSSDFQSPALSFSVLSSSFHLCAEKDFFYILLLPFYIVFYKLTVSCIGLTEACCLIYIFAITKISLVRGKED